jgi:glycosyltransferase involved in cell wall biosynthesis
MTKKLCFVSLSSYPLLGGENLGYVGGAEVQQVLLAKELVKHNYKVTFITYSDGQPSAERVGDIEVIKVYKREDVTSLSLLVKARAVWRAMKKADADIYFHEAGAPGVVPIFCFLRRKKFIFYIPSDANVSRELAHANVKFYHRVANWLDIKLANVIICQSEFQREMLEGNFGRKGLIIKNAFSLSREPKPEKTHPPIVLWVATIYEVKQPELFLKLAGAITAAKFQMIGGPSSSLDFYNRVKEAAIRMPNLEFLGFVPFHQIDEYFKRASIFVNTSKYEGFSNTFIQAWMHYIPVVSLHSDPDDIIGKHKLGFHSKTLEQLVEDTKMLLANQVLREEMGENGRRYVEREHDMAHVVGKYIEVFTRLSMDKMRQLSGL